MSVYEVLRDDKGELLATVCLTSPPTDEERATLVEYFTWLRDRIPPLTPEQEAKQDASMARIRERNKRLFGEAK